MIHFSTSLPACCCHLAFFLNFSYPHRYTVMYYGFNLHFSCLLMLNIFSRIVCHLHIPFMKCPFMTFGHYDGSFLCQLNWVRNALWENIISVMFVKLLSKDIFTWIAKKKKIVLLWMSITQSVGGLNRTKTWRKGRFAFSARAGTFIFSHSLVSELLIFRPSNSNWITPPAFLALRLAEGR